MLRLGVVHSKGQFPHLLLNGFQEFDVGLDVAEEVVCVKIPVEVLHLLVADLLAYFQAGDNLIEKGVLFVFRCIEDLLH